MKAYQTQFIEHALKANALKFGEFTLKSGRISPYFFNAGQFYTGADLAALGRFYAQALTDANIEFDMLFGPAYKGIPLATSTASAFATEHQTDMPFSYNRKEAKTHGEGGTIVGAPLAGKVAIIDDVITAGTAIREVLAMIEKSPASVGVIVVGVNREERGQTERSAIEELEDETGVPVISIVSLSDIITYLENQGDEAHLSKMRDYRATYGV